MPNNSPYGVVCVCREGEEGGRGSLWCMICSLCYEIIT